MKNYDDKLEKYLTAIFGAVGAIAIIINLFLKGLTIENILDGLKDIAGLIVVIAVFLIANKMLRKGAKLDFNAVFEKHLKEWISLNDYLVCDNFNEEGKGIHKKRYCSMIIDHSNLVTRKKLAKDAAQNQEKGAFVYLPYFDENNNWNKKFDFRFNKRTFSRQNIYNTEDGNVNLKAILEQFSVRINDKFSDLGINAKAYSETIAVSFEKMEQNEENARKLVDMVEFVKTMVLALA